MGARIRPVPLSGALAAGVTAAVWVAAFQPGTWQRLAWAVGYGVAVWAAARRPLPAAAAVLALDVAGALLGADPENPAMLAPSVAVVYAVGRYAAPLAGVPVLTAFSAYATGISGWEPATLVFCVPLFGGPYAFGRLVARRTAGARSAQELRAAEAAVEPTARARAVVAEERTRLAAQTVSVVYDAVVRMVAFAGDGVDRFRLVDVQTVGREAVGELRRLLGLLRDEAQAAPQPAPRPGRRWVTRPDLATGLALLLLLLLEVVLTAPTTGPGSVVLSAACAASVVLRRRRPVAACVVAAVGCALVLVLGVPFAGGLWAGVLAALLAWSAAQATTSRELIPAAALLCFAALMVAGVHRDYPGNEAMMLVALGLGATSGYLWAERARAEKAALGEADLLRRRSSAVVESAVREERLRLARELHDVASGAVGAMVLQAGSAAAQWDRDPAAAAAALDQIRTVGAATLGELDALSRVLVGQAARGAADGEPDPWRSVLGQVERARAAGTVVDVSADPAVVDPSGGPERLAVRRVVQRVVQEALTNAVRYAPGARVRVQVRAVGDLVEVEVVDDGGAAAGEPQTGSGFGLVGLAERVRALGGEFSAGPRAGPGFAVRAVLPATRPVPTETVAVERP